MSEQCQPSEQRSFEELKRLLHSDLNAPGLHQPSMKTFKVPVKGYGMERMTGVFEGVRPNG